MQDTESGSGGADREKKQPYRTPTLANLGKVADVTQGGAGALPDTSALYSQ